MYLKKIRVLLLKIKNIALLCIGLLMFFVSAYYIIDLFTFYSGNMETVLYAPSTYDCFITLIVCIPLFIYIFLSHRAIKRAGFYSSFFEVSLYSSISYKDLADVTGYPILFIKPDLRLLRLLYMKGFDFRKDKNGEYIELRSKKVQCTCKNCGADIDKKIYFTGYCPYCKTADVFATVISDNKVYSIKSEFGSSKTDNKYYRCRFFMLKFLTTFVTTVLSLTVSATMLMMSLDYISKYSDQSYLEEQILYGGGPSSFELIQKDIISLVIFALFFGAVMLPIVILSVERLILLSSARIYSPALVKARAPYISIRALSSTPMPPAKIVRRMRKILGSGFLRNCTVEKHGDKLKIAVARKIVKDECPTCGAPIVGAVDENYTCKYCRKRIMHVIVKE